MGLQWGSEWQQCYVEALLERDPLNLAARVEIAERVILARVGELCMSSDGEQEWQAIEGAISGLAALRREVLRSPIEIKKARKPDIVKPRMLAS
jgi:hypothetical protein